MRLRAALHARTLAVVISAAGLATVVEAADQPVQWANPINVNVRGSRLQKVTGCEGCDDAGAVSRQAIRSGDGYAEFTIDSPYTFWLAGLSRQGSSLRFDDIDFAFRFNGNGRVDILENGQYQSDDTTCDAGDVFRIAVIGGRVQYFKNGDFLHESRRAPQYPLVFEAALGSVGTTVADARIDLNPATVARNDNGRSYPNDEFALLDRNNDGVVSLREWRGSSQAFDRLDLDGDGVLTFRELARGEPGSVGTSGRNSPNFGSFGGANREFRVDPSREWTPTGIRVNEGDWIAVDAQGSVQLSTNPDDSAGPGGSRVGRRAENAPLRNQPAGALIGRVGNSAPFFLGEQGGARAPASGELLLGVNDDFFRDNSGEYRVIITLNQR